MRENHAPMRETHALGQAAWEGPASIFLDFRRIPSIIDALNFRARALLDDCGQLENRIQKPWVSVFVVGGWFFSRPDELHLVLQLGKPAGASGGTQSRQDEIGRVQLAGYSAGVV